MKYLLKRRDLPRFCVILALAAIFSCPLTATAQTETVIFEDNFEGIDMLMPDGSHKLYPDRRKWAFTFWPGVRWPDSYGDGTNWLEGNDEAQTYVTPFLASIKGKTIPHVLRYDPFSIEKDGLHIKADLLNRLQQRAYQIGGHRRFGSGMLLSRTSFIYGKIRVVAKLPSARGSWPAFWMIPASPGWPPEIDPLEGMAWGSHATQIHSGYITRPEEKDAYPGFGQWFDIGVNPSEGFHEYGLDWNKEKITALFDGKVLWERPTAPSMHKEMMVIINLAVGGKWPYNELQVAPTDDRSPERLSRGSDLIEKDYPAEMIIKSIRIIE